MEQKNKFQIDKKELARQRKREADRRRRRLKAEQRRAQQSTDKDALASQSLSSLSTSSLDATPKRQQLPAAPFLVGRTNMRRPGMISMPARGPGGRFLPGTSVQVRPQQSTKPESGLLIAASPPTGGGGGGLTTYMPGMSTVPRPQPFNRGPPIGKRLLPSQTPTGTSRLLPAVVNSGQQMAPITVQSAGTTQAKVIKVSDVGMLSTVQVSNPKSNQATTSVVASGIVATDSSSGSQMLKVPSTTPKR